MFSIGCDPELFLWDNVLQRIVPAVGKIGGTKQKPLRLSKGTVQLDGTVIEIGTDPAYTADEFIDNLQSVISEVRAKLYGKFKGRYDLRCGAIAAYNPEDCNFSNEVLEVGCEPDFTLRHGDGTYTLEQRAVPHTHTNISKVCTGGHIHIGFGCNLPITDERLLVSVGRYVESTPQVVAGNTFTTGRLSQLRMLINNPVRIKPYGVELRKFDAYWLSDRELVRALSEVLKGRYLYLRDGTYPTVPGIPLRLRDNLRRVVGKLPAKYQGTLPLDF